MKKLLSLVLALVMVLSVAVVANAAPITNFNDWQTIANEMERFCIQNSQGAVDLNVLSNCIDGLLTNDNHGALKPAVAKAWHTEDGGLTWTFDLRDDATWVDYKGEYKADVVADDFLWGLEFVLNYSKNESANTSMPMEMIAGAAEYYEFTKAMALEGSTDGKTPSEEGTAKALALGLDDFKAMVGIEAPDDYTVVYHCTAPLSYFPTLAAYCSLSPISGDLLADIGAEAYLKISYDQLWYNGPYTITEFVGGNQKVLTANPTWYGKDEHSVFETVTVKMIESTDVGYQLYQNGEVDQMDLNQSVVDSIKSDPANPYYNYAVEARSKKYSYVTHFNYDMRDADGNPCTDWNTAIANEAFRLAWYYGIDWTPYLTRTNALNPFSCQNYAYTKDGVAVNDDGVDYANLVLEELGLHYGNDSDIRTNPEKAAEYRAQAKEELTALGITLPVQAKYYVSGSNSTAMDTAKVLKQIIEDAMGDLVTINIDTYVGTSFTPTRKARLYSFVVNGWGADFGDPVNFLGQETYGDDNAYYAQSYGYINDVDPEVESNKPLIATYKEFTQLVTDAKAITDDNNARMAAFAKAEAFYIQHGLTTPIYKNVGWKLSKVNEYSKVYCAYGMQSTRYVDWETEADGYTAEQMAAFADAYNAQ